jgi:DNA polymerase III sliding clamp (beta) subunit (PCNA family)
LIVNAKRRELSDAVNKAAPAAHVGILLEADGRGNVLRLTAAGDYATIRITLPARVKSGGAVVVANAMLLSDCLARAPGDEIALVLSKDGRALEILPEDKEEYLHLTTPAEKDYPRPEIPAPGETVCVTGLKSLLAAPLLVAERSGSAFAGIVRLALGGDGVFAEAVGAFTVVRTEGDKDAKGDVSLALPTAALRTFARIAGDKDVFELGVTGADGTGTPKTAVFFDGALLFAARLLGDAFPGTDLLFEQFGNTVLSANVHAHELSSALASATAIASPEDPVGISFSDGGILLKCETEEAGAESFISAVGPEIPKASADMHFFNAVCLSQHVRTQKGVLTIKVSERGHLIVQSVCARYLQLAVRNAKTKTPEKDAA